MLSRDWEINLAPAALLPGFLLVGPPAGSAFHRTPKKAASLIAKALSGSGERCTHLGNEK